MRGVATETEVLRHVVGLIENTTAEVFADTEPDDIRSAATLVRTASAQLVETSLCLAAHLGAMKFLADMESITIEEPSAEERATFVQEPPPRAKKAR